jgi:hypothetical protein
MSIELDEFVRQVIRQRIFHRCQQQIKFVHTDSTRSELAERRKQAARIKQSLKPQSLSPGRIARRQSIRPKDQTVPTKRERSQRQSELKSENENDNRRQNEFSNNSHSECCGLFNGHRDFAGEARPGSARWMFIRLDPAQDVQWKSPVTESEGSART